MAEDAQCLVYDDDLDGLLDASGLSQRVGRGQLRCPSCGQTITRDNLGFIIMGRDESVVGCDSALCYDNVMRIRGRAEVE